MGEAFPNMVGDTPQNVLESLCILDRARRDQMWATLNPRAIWLAAQMVDLAAEAASKSELFR